VILVAEDTTEMRELLVDVFTAEGYSVVSAADGHQALAALSRYRVDVLVLDLVMPWLDGWAVLRQLPRDGAPRVIALSANHDLHGVEDHPLIQAAVAKPFDLDNLLTLVGTAAQDR
jgi:CheY-like chemotaxis protein